MVREDVRASEVMGQGRSYARDELAYTRDGGERGQGRVRKDIHAREGVRSTKDILAREGVRDREGMHTRGRAKKGIRNRRRTVKIENRRGGPRILQKGCESGGNGHEKNN